MRDADSQHGPSRSIPGNAHRTSQQSGRKRRMTSLAAPDDDDDDDGELTIFEEGNVGQASHVARLGLRASILTGHLHAGRSKHSKDETTLRARGKHRCYPHEVRISYRGQAGLCSRPKQTTGSEQTRRDSGEPTSSRCEPEADDGSLLLGTKSAHVFGSPAFDASSEKRRSKDGRS